MESVASATAAKMRAGLQAEGRLRPSQGSTLTVGPLVVDLGAYEAKLNGAPVALQPQQFRVLVAQARHAGQVLGRDQLTEMTYDDPGSPDVRSVDVAILRMRRAFGPYARPPKPSTSWASI